MSDDGERLDRAMAALRAGHPDMVRLFTEGQCYTLFQAVQAIFPRAVPLHSILEGHIYISLDGGLFDIRGRHDPARSDLFPVEELGDPPHLWAGRDYRRLVDTPAPRAGTASCPCCRAPMPDAMPADKLASLFPNMMGSILRVLEDGETKTIRDLVDGTFGAEPEHWPKRPKAAVRVVISQRRARLAELGWAIVNIRGTGYRLARVSP